MNLTSIITISVLALLFTLTYATSGLLDNTCTFRVEGRLFVLSYLNRNAYTPRYYSYSINDTTLAVFNFCQPFTPDMCPQSNISNAYAFLVHTDETNESIVTCVPYSSDSKTSYFTPQYLGDSDNIQLGLIMTTAPQFAIQRQVYFLLDCEENNQPWLTHPSVDSIDENKIVIKGESPYACPVFELNSLWVALEDNKLIFGIVLFAIGFIMLFYGIFMTHLLIFVSAYILTFIVLAWIFSSFLTPYSSQIAIYFSLLIILFLSTLVAYTLSKFVNISIFFIGAFFGFLVGALVNTIFSKIFDVYSVWSLVVFEILFTIPCGLLTFKYSDEIIVLSSSLTGAYMVVRPFSWIFGGFPNQFTLYQVIDSGSVKQLPWTVFIYIIFILAIFALGALYQISKIHQRNNGTQVRYLPEGVESKLDAIHNKVESLMGSRKNDSPVKSDVHYERMNQTQLEKVERPRSDNPFPESKQRRSKQQDF